MMRRGPDRLPASTPPSVPSPAGRPSKGPRSGTAKITFYPRGREAWEDGKKKAKEMDKQRGLFVEGCATHNDISAKKANEIFDLIDKFAGYGFNKSHSAAYGLITYQRGFLKHHFRVAFMAALMTADKDKNENVVKFIAEARGAGIGVLPPDVNESGRDFSVVERAGDDGASEQEPEIAEAERRAVAKPGLHRHRVSAPQRGEQQGEQHSNEEPPHRYNSISFACASLWWNFVV